MSYNSKLQWKTYRFIERYTNLERKCQLCGEKAKIICSDEFLVINLLCTNCRKRYKGKDIPKIPVKAYMIKEPPHQITQKRFENYKDIILEEIENGATCPELSEKYRIVPYKIYGIDGAKEKLRENAKKKIQKNNNKYPENLMQKYRINNQLSIRELSVITGIPEITIRKIECGEFNIGNKTRKRLDDAKIFLDKEENIND